MPSKFVEEVTFVIIPNIITISCMSCDWLNIIVSLHQNTLHWPFGRFLAEIQTFLLATLVKTHLQSNIQIWPDCLKWQTDNSNPNSLPLCFFKQNNFNFPCENSQLLLFGLLVPSLALKLTFCRIFFCFH